MRPPPRERGFPKTFPEDQCLDPNLVALRGLALPGSGAGDGNRKYRPGDNNRFKSNSYELARALRVMIV
jgi:hypothetical protein